MKLLKFTRHTRLRVTLSLLMVLALVFGCVGAFAGEAMALGGTVNDGDCVLIRGVKSGKNLMILGGLDNATNQPNIILYDAHDDYGSQKWLVKKLTVSGREYTVFRSYFAQQYVLAFNGTANANGGRLYLKKLASTTAAAPAEAQFFVRNSAGGGTVAGVARLVTRKSIEADDWHTLDSVGGATANNTQIQQYAQFTTVDASVNQLFVFEQGSTSGNNGRVTAYDLDFTTRVRRTSNGGRYVDYENYLSNTSTIAWGTMVQNAITALESKSIVSFNNRAGLSGPFQYPPLLIYGSSSTNPNEYGWYNHLAGKAYIYTNNLANSSNLERQKTITHELGHVLGMAHTNGRGNIMSQGAYAYGLSFGIDDRKALDVLANEY